MNRTLDTGLRRYDGKGFMRLGRRFIAMMVRYFGLLIFSLVIAARLESVHAATPLTKVLLTTGSVNEREAAIYVAQEQGYFRRYGLDVQFVQVRSGSGKGDRLLFSLTRD